jgi:predicted small integral membrane protein
MIYFLCNLQEKTAVKQSASQRFHSKHVDYFFSCSHFWFATLQEVLLADWHEVWHSPQPPFLADSFKFLVFSVLILFMNYTSFCLYIMD